MKTKTLLSSKTAIFLSGAVVAFALTASSAFAAVVPIVNTTIRNSSNTTVSSAAIGSSVHANALVSSSTGPTALGTVNFSLYPNTTCSGVARGVQSGVLLASGAADSVATTVPNTGLSYRVSYDGQTDVYLGAVGGCVSVLPTSGVVTLSSALSSTSVVVGTSVYQTSSLNGETGNATGTVAYSVYTNNSCTADRVDAGTKTVTNGTVPQSNSIQFNNVGTLYLQAVYSGDQNNNAATSTCRTLSVLATPTPTPTPTPSTGSGSISGTLYNDMNRNMSKDSGEAGIAGVTVKLHGGTFFSWNWNKRGTTGIRTVTTDANGNYSFASLPDGIYGVEEIVPTNWKQISSDFKWVVIVNGKQLTGLDFANYAKASSTATTTPGYKNHGQEKKAEKMEQKEMKKEAQKQRLINKFLLKIEKIKSR